MQINNAKYEVSIILALYNSRQFFKRAINSVINQTFQNYELIIIDDGSDDGIEEVLFPVLKKHGNFKYLRHSNRKHPVSLNSGILLSSAELITFLDSDDEYANDHIGQRINFFRENSSVDLIHSPATIVGDEKDFYVPDAYDNSKLIHINDCIIGGTLFGKRKVFLELDGFKNIYSHDSEFHRRAKEKFNVRDFPSPTYIYHKNNPDSVTNKLKESSYDR